MQASVESIINIQGLTREFSKQKALDNIDLKVKPGQVIGIIGENGAGKTTLIKHLLGLYKAQKGSVSVFGLDPVKHPAEVLGKIGYLSEQPDLPNWMTVAQYMNYMSAFYTNWNKKYANILLNETSINLKKKIKDLSKGQQARVGLCAAQAHKPELLLLDEPSSGLDPLVRKEILSAVIRTVIDEGRSVIFSSHLLDEVERVCDHLVILNQGQLVLSAPMQEVLENHKTIITSPDSLNRLNKSKLKQLPGFINLKKKHDEWHINFNANEELLLSALKPLSINLFEIRAMTLDQIFTSYCTEQKINGE